MSLSEQIQRVDGSQNSTLKTILEKLGVSPGSSKIDQYPTVANGISNKVSPNNILSSGTATSYGLSSSATANDVFVKIKSLIDSVTSTANSKTAVVVGEYAGNYLSDNSTSPNIRTISLGFTPKAVIVVRGVYGFAYPFGVSELGKSAALITKDFGTPNANYIGSLTTGGFRVYDQSYRDGISLNTQRYTYYYIAFK